MDANISNPEHAAHAVIGCSFDVLNKPGAGFVEKIYENAPAHEIQKRGLAIRQKHGISVFYDNVIVGQYTADLLVEDRSFVELKATRRLKRLMPFNV